MTRVLGRRPAISRSLAFLCCCCASLFLDFALANSWPVARFSNGTVGVQNAGGKVMINSNEFRVVGDLVVEGGVVVKGQHVLPPKCMLPGGDKLQYNGTHWFCVCVENWSGETCETPPSPPPSPPPLPPPLTPVLRSESTAWQSADDGNQAIYLDKHNVDCGNDGLHQFKLDTNDPDIQYRYTCLDGPDMTLADTSTGDNTGGAVEFLDRHTVDCEYRRPITQFQLVNLGDNKIKYSYKCGQILSYETCNTYETSWSDGVGKGDSIRWLHNHDVSCPNTNEYLTKFKLATGSGNDSGKIRYEYTCCPWTKNIQV